MTREEFQNTAEIGDTLLIELRMYTFQGYVRCEYQSGPYKNCKDCFGRIVYNNSSYCMSHAGKMVKEIEIVKSFKIEEALFEI